MADVLADIWDKVLRYLQKYHSESWRSWFEQIEPVSLENGLLCVTTQERSWMQYLQQEECNEHLKEAIQQITGRLIGFEVAMSDQTVDEPKEAMPEPRKKSKRSDETDFLYFSPDYTFQHFVVGPCNRLSHAACVAVSEAPGTTYNPLFIHGAVGLGKTHLLQAASQAILKKNSDARVMYLSCEMFVNHFIHAVEEGDLYNFRYKYRHVDMLVIDDIQFLNGRDRSQEEFFHTFNTLYQSGKQIILSADCSPSEMPNLEERLISRFNQGLVTAIDKPCFETRMSILHKKAQMRSMNVPEEVTEFIARRVENNTRELEGSLTKVYGMAMLDGGEITLDLAKQALGDDPTPSNHQITISQIIDSVTEHFNVRLGDLQGRRRSRSIAFPRQVCMYLARDLTRHSLVEIGGHFGGRDHSTVLHACRNIDTQCDHDPKTRAMVDTLVSGLTQKV